MSKEIISTSNSVNGNWPQRSLFGSNIDSPKQMSNINYQHFLSGSWKNDSRKKGKGVSVGGKYLVYFFLKVFYFHYFAIQENQILFDLKKRLEEQKDRVKKSNTDYKESKENALKFITQKDMDLESVRSTRAPSERSQAVSVRNSLNQLNPVQNDQVEYKLNGSILDLSYKNPKLASKTREKTLSSTHSDYKNNLEEQNDYNAIQMKYMNAYYPSRDQLVDNFKTTNDRINSTISSKSSLSIDEIPQNLKHKFKTKQAIDLMKSQEKVERTIAKLQTIEDAKKHKFVGNEELTRPVSATIDPKQNAVYYDLSNYLRHAICHGYPDLKKRSFKEHVHNANVNKEYLSDPDNYTLQNRRKKDWLGKRSLL